MPLLHVHPFSEISTAINRAVNPYVDKLSLASKEGLLPVRYGPQLEGLKGNWKAEFEQIMNAKPESLVLEIGCHLGETLRELAQSFPKQSFIGVDITFKRVVVTAEKAKNLNISNLVAVYANAKFIDLIFSPEELSGIVAFFPDPWEKKKSQQHNRLFNLEFCRVMYGLVQNNGFFWFKTDHLGYFEETSENMKEAGWLPALSLPSICSLDHQSKFERKFTKDGKPIYEKVWIKSNHS